VSVWLNEAEDDQILNDSDYTNANSDFCITNNVESDEISDKTTSNVQRRLRSLSSDNSNIISEPELFLGKDKTTNWYKNNPPSNIIRLYCICLV